MSNVHGNIALPSSIYGIVSQNINKRYFKDEISNRKFNKKGLLATANLGPDLNTSTFFITLTDDNLSSYEKKHTIFGEIVEGLDDTLQKINSAYVDDNGRPL